MSLILPELFEEEKTGLIREAYLVPGSERVREIIKENVNRGGYFRYVVVENDWTVEWLDKQKQKIDFAVFDQIYDLLWATKETDDEEFARQILPIIETVAKGSPLFELLDRTFSKSSQHLSVLQHTLDVLRKLKTKGMGSNARFLMRVEAVTHDKGKSIAFNHTEDMFVLDEDYMQTHAFLSARIWREYAKSRGLKKSLMDRVEQVLAYHHGLELIDNQILTLEEFSSLLPEEIILYLCTLAVSDVFSAHPGGFDMNNLEISWSLMRASAEVEAKVDEAKSLALVAQFFPLIIESTLERIAHYEKVAVEKAARLRAKLVSFIEFLYSLPIIEAVRDFLQTISAQLPHAVLEFVQPEGSTTLAATPA